jgi:hypothetical protein
MNVDPNTGEILDDATGEIVDHSDFASMDNTELALVYTACARVLAETREDMGRVEMELARRMRESGGRGLPADGYEIKQTPEIIWDEMKLMTLPEVLSPAEWGEIYTPEGVKPVPPKLNKARLRQALRKHGENSEPGKIITGSMTEVVGKITVEQSE